MTRLLLAPLAVLLAAACSGRESEPYSPPESQPTPTWAANVTTVAQSPVVSLPPASATPGGRDELGSLHLVWADGPVLRHGVLPLGGTQWTLLTIPTTSGARIYSPNISYAAPGVFIASWIEDRSDGTLRVMVARSGDHGATWDPSLVIASGATVRSVAALRALQRTTGASSATVVWIDGTPARVRASTWDGTTWNLSKWSTPATVSHGLVGAPTIVTLANSNETLLAAWDETPATANARIVMARSTNAGTTWATDTVSDVTVTGKPVTSLSVALASGTTRYVAWSTTDAFISASTTGMIYSTPVNLGPGANARVSAGDAGRGTVTWDYMTTTAESDSRSALALTYDSFATVSGPWSMPGGQATPARAQTLGLLAGRTLDMLWVDVSGGSRAIQYRVAALP